MKILLSNDDGIHAYGLRALARVLCARNHTVYVAAPHAERSGSSHAIALGDNGITYISTDYPYAEQAYIVDGMPADCVKFACLGLNVEPDLIISGVNHGNNVGSEILYSGTVSAAFEGAYLGYPSIAVSCGTRDNTALLDAAAEFIADFVERTAVCDLPPFSILNVNYPCRTAVGSVVTGMGVQIFRDAYERNGEKYFLRGYPIGYEHNDADCDVEWILKNYITITPLKCDRTDYALLKTMKETF